MTNPLRQQSTTGKQAAASCDRWNQDNPVGTPVMVTKDDGAAYATSTRSDAFVSYSGHAVIFLLGISGYYLLDRVEPIAMKPVA